MAFALAGVATVLLWHVADALIVDRQAKPGQVITPEIVIPGEWMTDPSEHFLILPLTIPADMALPLLKVMTNGQSVLVVVTEKPKEEPTTKAMLKYKLIVEAIKKEAGHDEKFLQNKLQAWQDTEDDDEVKVHIKAALDSLVHVRATKAKDTAQTVSVSLGSVPKGHNSHTSLAEVSTVLRGADRHIHHHHHYAKIIKESFAVEIPYPVPTENIVLISTIPGMVVVAMPLDRHSLEAKGVSTGAQAYLRVPVFDKLGQWIAGPEILLSKAASGLDVASVVSLVGFKPLED